MAGSRVTWRLVVPGPWGRRGDPAWLPAVGAEAWQRIFATEDLAGQVLRERGAAIPWRVAAEASSLLSSVLEHYRIQLRVAEDVAAGCQHAAGHLGALAAASAGTDPPTRTHPPGAWLVRAWVDGSLAHVAQHRSIDAAEGDVAARRAAPSSAVCWVEPTTGPSEAKVDVPGWHPRVAPEIRSAAFAVEDAIASLCAATELGLTGPDVLDVRLLCMLGEASWRCIREYRDLMAAVWGDMERCAFTAEHERDATAAMEAMAEDDPDDSRRRWRHLMLAGGRPVELSVHESRRNAAASVAVARAIDETAVHWAVPAIPEQSAVT